MYHPLIVAFSGDNVEAVDLLLKFNAEPNACCECYFNNSSESHETLPETHFLVYARPYQMDDEGYMPPLLVIIRDFEMCDKLKRYGAFAPEIADRAIVFTS
jgi:hypothetical protein